jgi:DNA-binding CsgD family transcriptional regulator/tetratricopeptide (TPR) repeat protein
MVAPVSAVQHPYYSVILPARYRVKAHKSRFPVSAPDRSEPDICQGRGNIGARMTTLPANYRQITGKIGKLRRSSGVRRHSQLSFPAVRPDQMVSVNLNGGVGLLVERDWIIETFDHLLSVAGRRRGALVIVNGPPAIGKTRLLEALAERATTAGARVLRAAGCQTEQRLPYAVLSQLIDRAYPTIDLNAGTLADADQKDTSEGLLDAACRLYDTVVKMTSAGTVFIAVDDIQDADVQSMHCLRYLAHRVTSVPVVIVLACVSRPQQMLAPVVQELLYSNGAWLVHLNPLSVGGVAQLLQNRLRCARPTAAADEYHRITGGNPLLLDALCVDNPPSFDCRPDITAGKVHHNGHPPAYPMPEPGEMFRHAVLACAYRVGPLAVRVARSAALLDGAESVFQLSRMSGVGVGLVRRTIEALTDIGLFDNAQFRHSAAQSAFLDEIPAQEAIRLHHRAARILYGDGESPQRAAQHLRMAGPPADDWAVNVLVDAARHAMTNGPAAEAIQCLELAIEGCARDSQQLALKVELANMLQRVRPAASAQQFLSLKAQILAGKLSGSQALSVVDGLLWHLLIDDSCQAIGQLSADLHHDGASSDVVSSGISLLLEASFPGLASQLMGTFRPSSWPRVPIALPADSPDLRILETLAAVLAQASDDHTIAQAEQVLRGANLVNGTLKNAFPALMCLVYTDRLESAAEWATRLITAGADGEAPTWLACASSYSALVSFRRGFLDVAVEQAESALAHVRDEEFYMEVGLAIATLVEAHTAVGNHQTAAEYLARPVPEALFQTRIGLHYVYARGQHQLAVGRPHAALADFLSCGERMVQWKIDNAAIAPWRVGAAQAWLSLGDKDPATQLLEEQIGKLGGGLARTYGITLRSLAAVREISRRPAILKKSLQALQLGGDRYEAARVLADLSCAYRAMGAKAEARTAERRAYRIAKGCHAEALCQELLPTVSQIGRNSTDALPIEVISLLGQLSVSERRVAVLAGQGYTNREISTKLFITVSTVEQHLTRIYRKMAIRSREELPAELNLSLVSMMETHA